MQKLQKVFFANFYFMTSAAFYLVPFKRMFSTSLQPISCCKAIKTSEKGEEKNPFRYSLFLCEYKKQECFYNFIAFLVLWCLLLFSLVIVILFIPQIQGTLAYDVTRSFDEFKDSILTNYFDKLVTFYIDTFGFHRKSFVLLASSKFKEKI